MRASTRRGDAQCASQHGEATPRARVNTGEATPSARVNTARRDGGVNIERRHRDSTRGAKDVYYYEDPDARVKRGRQEGTSRGGIKRGHQHQASTSRGGTNTKRPTPSVDIKTILGELIRGPNLGLSIEAGRPDFLASASIVRVTRIYRSRIVRVNPFAWIIKSSPNPFFPFANPPHILPQR